MRCWDILLPVYNVGVGVGDVYMCSAHPPYFVAFPWQRWDSAPRITTGWKIKTSTTFRGNWPCTLVANINMFYKSTWIYIKNICVFSFRLPQLVEWKLVVGSFMSWCKRWENSTWMCGWNPIFCRCISRCGADAKWALLFYVRNISFIFRLHSVWPSQSISRIPRWFPFVSLIYFGWSCYLFGILFLYIKREQIYVCLSPVFGRIRSMWNADERLSHLLNKMNELVINLTLMLI